MTVIAAYTDASQIKIKEANIPRGTHIVAEVKPCQMYSEIP